MTIYDIKVLTMAEGGQLLLADLKPVVLANDDFDYEITYLKEVAQTEFSKNQDATLVNVSSVQSVQVTPDNVNSLFNNIIAPDSQNISLQCGQYVAPHPESTTQVTQNSCLQNDDPLSVDNLLSLVRSYPKDLFITQVLQDSSSDRDRLDSVRTNILGCIQQTDGYPFDSRASLKKRIDTRKGDSVEYKLAQDIYCLSSVLDGADWDDLRDVLNISRPKKSQSQAAADISFQAINITEMEILKRAVQGLTADMIAIKQENIALKSEIKVGITSLRKDLNELRTECTADLNETRGLIATNAQSVDRICNERSNGIANIKSEIKLIKTDVKNILDEPILTVRVTSLHENINKVSALEKRLGKLEKRVPVEQPQPSVPPAKASTGAGACKQPLQTAETNQYRSVPSEQPTKAASSVDHSSSEQQHKILHVNKSDNSALIVDKTSNKLSRVPLEPVLDSQEKQKPPAPKGPTYSSVATSKPNDQASRNNVLPSTSNDRQTSYRPHSHGVSSNVNQSSDPQNIQTIGTSTGNSNSSAQNQIPVRVNGRLTDTKTNTSCQIQFSHGDDINSNLADDIEFSSFVRKRSKRFYIGGFKSSIT